MWLGTASTFEPALAESFSVTSDIGETGTEVVHTGVKLQQWQFEHLISYDLCMYVGTQLTTCSQQATYCYMVLSSPSLCAQRSQREPAGQSDQNVGWNLRAIGWKSHFSSRASQTTTFWFYQCLSSRFSVCNQEVVASTTLWPMLQYLTHLTAVALLI